MASEPDSKDRAETDWDALDTQRYANTGRLLMLAMRAFNERAMAAVQAAGHPELSFAHASVLPHVAISGSRLTRIAADAGMRKQSAAALLAELEAADYLERAPDPSDRRAALYRFTDKGRAFLQVAARVKAEIEAELAAHYGEEDYAQLRALLLRFPGAAD